jgi:MFS family permease
VFNNGVLLVASVLFGLISKYTSTILLLSIGRLLIGVYTGLSCALVPIYIQEVAPDHLKVHLFCLFISIHIFLFKQIPQNEYTFLIILEFYSIEN